MTQPAFALILSSEGIALAFRNDTRWDLIGQADPASATLGKDLIALREQATAQSGSSELRTRIIIPNDQIRYMTLELGHLSEDLRHERIRLALDGATPYPLDQLVYDIRVDGAQTHVAAVALETLQESEDFARQSGFTPDSFGALALDLAYGGEPYFGRAGDITDALLKGSSAAAMVKPRKRPAEPDMEAAPSKRSPWPMLIGAAVVVAGGIGGYLATQPSVDATMPTSTPQTDDAPSSLPDDTQNGAVVPETGAPTLITPPQTQVAVMDAVPHPTITPTVASPVASPEAWAAKEPVEELAQPVEMTESAEETSPLLDPTSADGPTAQLVTRNASDIDLDVDVAIAAQADPLTAPNSENTTLPAAEIGTSPASYGPTQPPLNVTPDTASEAENIAEAETSDGPVVTRISPLDPAERASFPAVAPQQNAIAFSELADPSLPSVRVFQLTSLNGSGVPRLRPIPPEPDLPLEAREALAIAAASAPKLRPEGGIRRIYRVTSLDGGPKLRPAGLTIAKSNQDQQVSDALASASLFPTEEANSPARATPRSQTITPKAASSAAVAKAATQRNKISLGRVALMGVSGASTNRKALVRMPNGRIKSVKVGDSLDGGRVVAISQNEVRYQKSGQNLTLKMPRG